MYIYISNKSKYSNQLPINLAHKIGFQYNTIYIQEVYIYDYIPKARKQHLKLGSCLDPSNKLNIQDMMLLYITIYHY